MTTLPELAREERIELLRSLSATRLQKATRTDQRRAEAYMASVIGNLESMAPNTGRKDALNRAAWTLGRWVAAGAL